MVMKSSQHVIKGMTRDLSVSKFSPEFAYECKNIRITARDNSTLLTVTNERGNLEVTILSPNNNPLQVEGSLLGYNVLNNYVTLFTTGDKDRIYRLENKQSYFEGIILYEGDLNFNADNPIENIGVYENDDIQKVYWVDGLNPPRVINITSTNIGNWNNSSFDFIPEVSLKEDISIVTNDSVPGQFPSGVIQYAFTYYNLYGAESNIVYQSPLYYSHSYNRGGSPEETGTGSINIQINNSDTNFEYIRIYSIVRSSIDGIPTVKQVADLKTSASPIYYTDSNTTGSIVDSTLLLFIGGEDIIPYTMTQKDNTLFLGRYKIKTSLFPKAIRDAVRGNVTFTNKIYNTNESTKATYNYSTQLNNNSFEITSFKGKETYRFGIQFQDKKGKWSEVLYIGDTEVDRYPMMDAEATTNKIRLFLIKALYSVPKTVIDAAVGLGYIKARGMIVYPNNEDRSIVCQGVINPTLWNNTDRESNSPYSLSSWFFRPFVDEAERDDTDEIESTYGSYANYKDYNGINPVYPDRKTEIGVDTLKTLSESVTENNDYFVDNSILTFHSPDIEFSDINLSNIALNCRLIGGVVLTSGVSYRSVTANTIGRFPDIDYGIYNKFPSYTRQTTQSVNRGGRLLISGLHWMGVPLATVDTANVHKLNWGWLVSPWQRQGSLINDFRYDGNTLSELKSNKLSNLRSSSLTYFGHINWTPPAGISNVELFDSNEISMVKLLRNEESLIYYGNIDKIVAGLGSNIGVSRNSASINRTIEQLYKRQVENTAFIDKIIINSMGHTVDLKDSERFTNSPVSLKFKSGKHAVFAFNKQGNNRVITPNTNGYTLSSNGEKVANYDHTSDTNAIFEFIDARYNGLWLVELTKQVNSYSRFGGNTEEALLNNIWNISGDATPIVDPSGKALSTASIEFLQGDTYLQRYDCIKTYPFTNEDTNSVVDIVSFYCETHINIDGRYDKNRGNINNLTASPTNFNLYNSVYSQRSNYFNYHYLNELSSLDYFPNTITWTKEKQLGSSIDTWTNINTASNLDLDGDKGEITSLNTFRNEIFAFQRTGLSNILFNSRVQIPASDGVPIEITNGMKVSGKRYISNTIGCNNKWSIVESPSGLYFIDNETNSIYLFNGELKSISDSLGMRQWVNENNTHTKWNPITYDNFRSFYDKNNNDVYFTNKNYSLCYSELIGQFTSFMSYEKVPSMFNIGSEFYSFHLNKLWHQFNGEYNMFFGQYKPYSITVVSNDDGASDKIFNNIEFRADTFDGNTLIPNQTFDSLDVYNEYQHGKEQLINLNGKPSSLKRKFRVWRANIPRANTSINGIAANNRDRIRNPWAYIKLSNEIPNTYRTVFHDMKVHYFV